MTTIIPYTRLMALTCPDCRELLRTEIAGEDAARDDGPYRTASLSKFHDINAVEIDRCHGCGGIWFDAGELSRFLRQKPTGGTSVDEIEPTRRLDRVGPAQASCLRCRGSMVLVRSEGVPWMIYAHCVRCRGIWLEGSNVARLDDPFVAMLALVSGEFA
ncbi:MAG: zf-TFIIB domain-containing protein [Myxococcales bacterium]|nr:zf-TFIIB domain-containing protein [Myxococcales bacterium]